MKPSILLFILFLLLRLSFCNAQTDTSKLGSESITETTDEDALIDYSENAIFPGGDDSLISFIKKNLVHPASAAKDDLCGKVVVCFKIEKTGKITEVRILKGIREDLNNEAMRVVCLFPDFIPAREFDKPVCVKMLMPFKFELP